MDPAEKLSRAKDILVLKYPFFASIVFRFELRASAACQTGYTDGTAIFYSPGWIDSLSPGETATFLAHLALHFALQHHLRRGNREHNRWNVAADHVVNLILKKDGFQLPRWAYCDRKFEGMDAETVYRHVYGGRGIFPIQIGADHDPGGCGGVRDYPVPAGDPRAEEKIRAAEKLCRKMLEGAAAEARAAGNVPAHLERPPAETRKETIDWKRVLAEFLDETVGGDYTWKAPNPRYLPSGVYLPSHGRERTGRVAVYIDTSGSVGSEEMTRIISEVHGIASACSVAVTVVYADCRVAGHREILPGDDPPRLRPRGGGGTDYRPAFEWAEAECLDPACAVYLTDGFCSTFPDREPDYPVLWALTEESSGFKPPWGGVMEVK